MSHALEQIQQTLQEIFFKNSNFFKNYHQDLYNQIMQFEENFNENYHIDFIDGHFELINKNGNITYNCDPFYDAKYRADNLFKDISGISTIDTKYREPVSNTEYDSNQFINQFTELLKNETLKDNLHFEKFIFIGTILGVHINDIANITNSKAYLIVEEDIEIFRLSMFLTDYEVLSDKSELFFAIGTNIFNLQNTIEKFLKYKYQYNYFIKFEITTQNEIPLLQKISKIISSKSKTIHSYSQFLESYDNCINNFLTIKKLINTNKKINIFDERPILFLGAGPSLQDNIDFIKKNKDRFIIVSVLASMKRVAKEDIVPDIIITIDNSYQLLDFLDIDVKYYKNALIFASTNTNKKLIKKLNISRNVYLFQTNIEVFANKGHFIGSNVGDIGVQFLIKLGAKNIYLLGLDAALHQETGSTHDETHHYKKIKSFDEQLDIDDADFGKNIFKTKGNLQKEVYTTGEYRFMIETFAQLKLDTNTKIYNLSNHGVYLQNTMPLELNNIKFKENIDKKNLNTQLQKCILPMLKTDISDEDKKMFTLEKQGLSGTVSDKIIKEYKELIEPYYNYIIDNYKNIKKKQVDKIYKNQLQILSDNIKNLINI